MASRTYDIVEMTKAHKSEQHGFFLDMKSWKKFSSKIALDWKSVRFSEKNKPHVPKQRGLYAFLLTLDPTQLPSHGYILYVGITGEGKSNADLRTRFGQYIRHQKNNDGRFAVLYMLKKWAEELVFHFVEVPDKKISLREIEDSFLEAVRPPVNKQFYGEINAVRAATF